MPVMRVVEHLLCMNGWGGDELSNRLISDVTVGGVEGKWLVK